MRVIASFPQRFKANGDLRVLSIFEFDSRNHRSSSREIGKIRLGGEW